MQSWITAGYLRDHTPFVEKAGGKAFLERFYPTLIRIGTCDGWLYGVPAFGGGYRLYYNTELFKAAGLDPNKPPTNWGELLDCSKKLSKKDASGNTVQWGYGVHGQSIPANVSRFASALPVSG